MDWLLELASKVGGSVVSIALIIVLAIFLYVAASIFKNRKELKGWFNDMVQKKTEEESQKKLIVDFGNRIEKCEKNIRELQDSANKFYENRKSDREQSLTIQKELNNSIKNIENSNTTNDEKILNLTIANRVLLGDKINQKYKQYIELGGIPEDEYEEFVNLHTAYKGCGGNHTGDAKYNYCIEHLPVLPVSTTPIENLSTEGGN